MHLSDIWMPSFPALERRLALVELPMVERSPIAVAGYRAFRLSYILATFPLYIAFVLAHRGLVAVERRLTLDKADRPSSIFDAVLVRRRGWTATQDIFYALISRVIWSIAGVGIPPHISREQERKIPVLSRLVEVLTTGDAELRISISQDEADLSPAEEKEWIVGDARDPAGFVQPTEVPIFWLKRYQAAKGRQTPWRKFKSITEVEEGPRKAAGPGERVILYLVGGGYVTGNPTNGTGCVDLARASGLAVAGANYRKATSPLNAFPAALQDACVAYTYLLKLGYREIIVGGDSAGAGLATSLWLYLCQLSSSPQAPAGLILPIRMLLVSPWCDLTLSTSSGSENERYDLLNTGMLLTASRSYLYHTSLALTYPPYANEHQPHLRRGGRSKAAVDASSPYRQGASHPLFSPALATSRPYLAQMLAAHAAKAPLPPVFVVYGGSEMFSVEIKALIGNLKAAYDSCEENGSDKVSVKMFEGELHCVPVLPKWIGPNTRESHKLIAAFVQGV